MSEGLPASQRAWQITLGKRYAYYALGFSVLIGVLAALEVFGIARDWIGYIFLFATVVLYATIGIFCRTSDPLEYYVAGRRVPRFLMEWRLPPIGCRSHRFWAWPARST